MLTWNASLDRGELVGSGHDLVSYLRGPGGLDKYFTDYEQAFGDSEKIELEVLEQAQREATGKTVVVAFNPRPGDTGDPHDGDGREPVPDRGWVGAQAPVRSPGSGCARSPGPAASRFLPRGQGSPLAGAKRPERVATQSITFCSLRANHGASRSLAVRRRCDHPGSR